MSKIIQYIKWWLIIYNTDMSFDVNDVLDKIISHCIKSGIKLCVSENEYYIMILFNDNTIYKCWNENRYYSWGFKSTLYFPDRDVINLKSVRLRKKTMIKLLILIENHKKSI